MSVGKLPVKEVPAAAGAHEHDDTYYTETEIDAWRNSVSQAEMAHLHGIGSDIQTQIDAKAPLASPNFTGIPLAPDHDAAATDMLVNVCYGTGAAPAANTTTIGSLYIKYIP